MIIISDDPVGPRIQILLQHEKSTVRVNLQFLESSGLGIEICHRVYDCSEEIYVVTGMDLEKERTNLEESAVVNGGTKDSGGNT